jgi:hypothetical protein
MSNVQRYTLAIPNNLYKGKFFLSALHRFKATETLIRMLEHGVVDWHGGYLNVISWWLATH